MNYKDITLEEAKEIYKKTGCILVCDADNMSINIEGELVNEIKELIDKLVNAVKPIIDRVVEVVKILGGYINNIFNKKIKKKRFIKLLQSRGIQRKQINTTIYDNKEKYTLFRYMTTIPPTIANKKNRIGNTSPPTFA